MPLPRRKIANFSTIFFSEGILRRPFDYTIVEWPSKDAYPLKIAKNWRFFTEKIFQRTADQTAKITKNFGRFSVQKYPFYIRRFWEFLVTKKVAETQRLKLIKLDPLA